MISGLGDIQFMKTIYWYYENNLQKTFKMFIFSKTNYLIIELFNAF